MKVKKLKKGERGFTLVEMLVVLALIGIITGGITAAIMQVLTINTRASNHMIAVRQVQQAGKEVSKDTLQAQNVTCGGSDGFPLTLTWTDSLDVVNNVTYTITNDNKLQRSHNVTGVRAIAQYIDTGQTSCCCDCDGDGYCDVDCNCDDMVVIFTVTATVGNGPYEAIETRVYQIKPRPDS